MKFGLFGGATARRDVETADSHGYLALMDKVAEAEQLGFHGVFLVEHHFTGIGQVSATLNLLTYMAAKTSTIRLGTAVTILTWHNPVLVAEQAATLDLVSNGRLDFGIGLGYRDAEFDCFCIDKSEAVERFQESLGLILKSWTSDERFSHEGKYYRFKDIIVEPPTYQKPHPPLWSGSGTEESITRCAKSGWNVLFDNFGTFERTEERLNYWRKACEASGRPFDAMEVGLTRAMNLTTSAAETEAALEARRKGVTGLYSAFGPLPGLTKQPDSFADPNLATENASLIGEADEVIGRLKTLEEMGFEYILFLIPNDTEVLRRFAKDVMPAFA